MRAINHALTGSLIGLTVVHPVIAVPAALISHFICDAIPHHGARTEDEVRIIRSVWFRRSLYIDAFLCVLLVFLLFVIHPVNWFLASVCAFVATSPDFLWINRYQLMTKGHSWKAAGFSKFANDIQWFQRPIGAVVEIVWFGAMIVLIASFLS